MTGQVILMISLSGDDLPGLFTAVASDPFFGFRDDVAWTVDGDERPPAGDWRTAIPRDTSRKASAFFDPGYTRYLGYDAGWCVKATFETRVDVVELNAAIARLPCNLVSVGPLHRDWLNDDALKLPPKMLGYGHYVYGSFVAFKGAAAHAHLVSRRWLEHGGPWICHKGPKDVSLLQLHDLDADSRTANAQVRAAQQRLGPADAGGYLPPGFKRTTKFDVQYSGRDRKASIVVAKRDVTPREMLDAASLRGTTALGADSPVDSVAFVYIDEAQARGDLHELWLHGLECWTYIDGRETRIDDAYVPPPIAASPW